MWPVKLKRNYIVSYNVACICSCEEDAILVLSSFALQFTSASCTSTQYSQLLELFDWNMYGCLWLQARGKCCFGSWAVATPRHSSIKKRLWKRKETQHILLVLLGKENDIVLARGYFKIHNKLKNSYRCIFTLAINCTFNVSDGSMDPQLP